MTLIPPRLLVSPMVSRAPSRPALILCCLCYSDSMLALSYMYFSFVWLICTCSSWFTFICFIIFCISFIINSCCKQRGRRTRKERDQNQSGWRQKAWISFHWHEISYPYWNFNLYLLSRLGSISAHRISLSGVCLYVCLSSSHPFSV